MKDPIKSVAYCPDCGPAGVASHLAERWSARAEYVFNVIEAPPAAIWRAIKPAVTALRPGRLAPPSARAAQALGLGKIIDHADDDNTAHIRVLWAEAERRGIAMYEFRPLGLPRELFYAVYNGDVRGFDGLPRPRGGRDHAQDWMDDKGAILKKFKKAGIPVPCGKSCANFAEAERTFREIVGDAQNDSDDNAVIVKPSIGSRSRHTFTHITDSVALRTAFASAKRLSPRVVVEEEIPGFVFRVTFVSGKVVGVMCREPPHVMGDGKHTVRELLNEENKNPLRQGPVFAVIPFGEEALAMLEKQNLKPDSVPAAGRMVILHPKVSRVYGASTTEIAEADIHPDNAALFATIAHTVNDPLFGVDVIMTDMAISWRDQQCGVIECNSLPAIDVHHDPLRGPARNVAGIVWDTIFPASRK